MLLLRDGGRERQLTARELADGVTRGVVPVQAQVRLESGHWQTVSLWYLEHSEIELPPGGEVQRFVERQTADKIDVHDVRVALGLDDEAERLEQATRAAVSGAIKTPDWAWEQDLAPVQNKVLQPPPWRPDPTGAIVDVIQLPSTTLTTPSWGVPFELPVIERLAVPEWTDPAESGLALPPRQEITWRRAETEGEARPDALVELLHSMRGPGPQRAPKPPPAKKPTRADKRRALRAKKHDDRAPSPQHRERPEPQQQSKRRKKERRKPEAIAPKEALAEETSNDQPPAKADVALPKGITIERSTGLFGCFGRLLMVGLLAFAALIAQDVTLRELTKALQRASSIAGPAQPRQSVRLRSELIQQGPADALVHIVMAIDFHEEQQVSFAANMLRAVVDQPLASGVPRVTILPLASGNQESERLRSAVVAAAEHGCFWKWLRDASQASGSNRGLRPGQAARAFHNSGCEREAFNTAWKDPKTELRGRTWSTMAAALQLGEGVGARINGTAVPLAITGKPHAMRGLLIAAAAQASQLSSRLGDDRQKVMAAIAERWPEPARERFLRWIVRGERLPSTPLSPPARAAQPAKRITLQLPPSVPGQGLPDAPATMIVFCDYSSAHCRKHAATVQTLLTEHSETLQVRWLQYPLRNGPPYARRMALAAIAAQKQGRFWAAHNWFQQHGGEPFEATALQRYLRKTSGAGLKAFSARSFRRDRALANKELLAHRRLAQQAGVNGAPFTLLNGEVLRGALSAKALSTRIERAAEDRQKAENTGKKAP